MEQGIEVEERARVAFPGGILVASPEFAMQQRLSETALALASDAPAVFEATVTAGGAIVSADVLRRSRNGLELIEVKRSTSVKNDDLADVAMQLWVLRAAGLTVPRAFLMHLNKDARYPALDQLFVMADVTADVEPLLDAIPEDLAAQHAMLAVASPPAPVLIRHCQRPTPCPLFAKCWPAMPEHHVTTLYQIRWKEVGRFLTAGRETIDRLQEVDTTCKEAKRQIRAVRARRRIVEDGLAFALDELKPPVAWLAFESVALAIPAWTQVAPHEHVPVQFSVRLTGAEADATHTWLAEPGTDARPAIAEALVGACARARTIVVYDARFERDCIRHLAVAVPQYADLLGEIHARIVDLLPIVRDHIYDPAFGGSFELGKVLRTLIPDLSDPDLADVGCERDTLAMLRLAEVLRAMAG